MKYDDFKYSIKAKLIIEVDSDDFKENYEDIDFKDEKDFRDTIKEAIDDYMFEMCKSITTFGSVVNYINYKINKKDEVSVKSRRIAKLEKGAKEKYLDGISFSHIIEMLHEEDYNEYYSLIEFMNSSKEN